MNRRFSARILSGVLACALLTLPAQALTTEQARALLSEYYIDPVPQKVLKQSSIQAMLDKLGDPYTQYFTAGEYEDFLASMEDTDLVGIGVVSQTGADGLTITSVLKDSPAAAGGLLAGDVIVAVDGRSVLGADADLASSWIRGEEGTPVEVTCLRGDERYTVTLTRARVVVPTTTSTLLDGHIGYFDCTTFGSDTYAHFQEGIAALRPQTDHWIVDLRGNGGGLTSAATQAAGAFTGAGNMGYLRDGAGRYSGFLNEDDALTIEPVIVLSDGHTASSSELFSACIRDRGAGIVVGGRTYGKGIAQTLFDNSVYPDYFTRGDAIKITTNRYFAPDGATTDTIGVIPHLLVDPDLAEDVALLLSAGSTGPDTSGFYRLDLKWRWYIDREQALHPEYRDAFTALLSAIPPSAKLWTGTGGPDGWVRIEPEEAAAENGLTYRDRSFSDTEESPYAASIDLLASYGILSGTGDGTFQPEEELTRAQLAVLLAAALNCKVPSGPSAFSDVPMDSWYGPSVNALSKLGLLSGDGRGNFRPDDPITHEALFSILARTAQNLDLSFYELARKIPDEALSNTGLIPYSGWAKESVWLLALSQRNLFGETVSLLWDQAGDIPPQAPATREEAAYLLCQVLSFTGQLPA